MTKTTRNISLTNTHFLLMFGISSSISVKEGNNAGADDQDLMKASLKKLRGLTTYICDHLKRVTQMHLRFGSPS